MTTQRTSIRIPDDLHDDLRAIAATNGGTLAGTITSMLTAAVERKESAILDWALNGGRPALDVYPPWMD